MPWFCGGAPKKKRSGHSKTKVGVAGKIDRRGGREGAAGRGGGGGGADDGSLSSQDRPAFAVVLQNFAASLVDELSVQRGQVVEVLYLDGDWSFVRNVDTGSGYVPSAYCVKMDKVQGNFNNVPSGQASAAGPLPRPRVINVDTLQRSGSSVNSVEVRQISSGSGSGGNWNNNARGGSSENSGGGGGGGVNPTPPCPTSPTMDSSSQAIYEVPRSPGHQPTTTTTATTPFFPPSIVTAARDAVSEVIMPSSSRVAPSLPPRSANLPSQAEIQRHLAYTGAGPQQQQQQQQQQQRPAFLPGCRQGGNPFRVNSNMYTSQVSHMAPAATPMQQQPHPQAPGSSYAYTPMNQSLPAGVSGHAHHGNSGLTQSYPSPQTCLPPNSHARPTTPHSSHNPFTIATQQQQHRNAPNSTPRPASSSIPIPVNRRMSAPIHAHHQTIFARQQVHPDCASLGGVADTPGSAGTPAVAPSPTSISARANPSSTTSGPNSTAVTPGYATRPKFASITPPAGVDGSMRWPAAVNSDLGYRKMDSRRNRRHSTDNMLQLAISEDSNVVSFSPPQTSSQRARRQQQRSQPCVASMGLQNSPPRRPNRLPVRRTLSMQESSRMAVVSSPRGEGGASSVPIHRAASYQEAVIGEDERKFGATASIKPSEIVLPEQQQQQQQLSSSREEEFTASCPAPGSAPGLRQKQSGRGPRTGRLDSLTLTASDTDDVFLPDLKKPYGIFQCVKPYKQKFKGEISLVKDELVIVLDRGRGEWAWAITSNNVEGLIPKSVLVRYSPAHQGGGAMGGDHSNGRIDAETQTELLLGSIGGRASPGGGGGGRGSGDGLATCREEEEGEVPKLKTSTREASPHDKSVEDAGMSSDRAGRVSHEQSTTSSSEGGKTATPAPDVVGRAVALVSVDSLTTTTSPDTSPMSTARSNKSARSCSSTAADADAELSDRDEEGGEERKARGKKEKKAEEEEGRPRSPPKEWFDTLDSVDAANVVSSINSAHRHDATLAVTSELENQSLKQSEDSEHTQPKSKDKVPVRPPAVAAAAAAAAAATGSAQQGVAKKPPTRKPSGIPRRKKHTHTTPAATTSSPPSSSSQRGQGASLSTPGANNTSSSGGRRHILVKSGTAHYHDRISGLGSVRFDGYERQNSGPSSPSSGPGGPQRQGGVGGRPMAKRPSTTLTAVKDYTPRESARNCLALEKGDVLQSQPHMHYPKGWMWVWHVRRKCFGYVPKSHIAYTYDTPPRERHRTESVEDAV